MELVTSSFEPDPSDHFTTNIKNVMHVSSQVKPKNEAENYFLASQ
jgi:hypothetical protein